MINFIPPPFYWLEYLISKLRKILAAFDAVMKDE